MVNANGERFVDEGADFRNYTYAKYGRVVLAQPGGYAWQVFDGQVMHLLCDEYKMCGATKVRADSRRRAGARYQGQSDTRLYAAGELVGRLSYFNYPGSAGLMAGSVFGRIAGRGAGGFVLTSA